MLTKEPALDEKPLSEEREKEIQRHIINGRLEGHSADESDGMHDPECLCCSGNFVHGTCTIDHAADCAWKLAQEC